MICRKFELERFSACGTVKIGGITRKFELQRLELKMISCKILLEDVSGHNNFVRISSSSN